MILLKKLIFAPIFLIIFTFLIYQLTSFFKSYDFVFSLSMNTFFSLIIVSAVISLSSFLFILFITLAGQWKLTLPVGIISALIPMLFIEPALALVFAVAIFVSLILTILSLDNLLKSYLTFSPGSLLGPSVRRLSGLLILSFCLVYFLSSSKLIVQEGFEIPDSLIDTALKMTPVNSSLEETSAAKLPALSSDQLELLKQNPDLLRQSGIDPEILDSLSSSQNPLQAPEQLTNNLIKQTVKDQIQGFIKPYINLIPAILAVLLFLTLQSLTSILNLLIYPLLWITFTILEKTGFIKFEIEQRPVKKLVV